MDPTTRRQDIHYRPYISLPLNLPLPSRQDQTQLYAAIVSVDLLLAAGAIDICELKQLEKIKVETQQSQEGLYIAIVQLYDKRNDLSRAGASQDRDEVVAEWLAFSNAVRQITF